MKNKTIIIIGILSIILILNISLIFAANIKYYNINFNYNNKTQILKLGSVKLETSNGTIIYYEDDNIYYPNYTIRLLDNKNKVLNSGVFYTCDFYMYDRGDPETGEIVDGGVGCDDRTTFSINTPYNPNARYVSVLNPKGREIIKYDINQKKTITGGAITDISTQDIKDVIFNYGFYIVLFIILVLIVLFYFLKGKKHKKSKR